MSCNQDFAVPRRRRAASTDDIPSGRRSLGRLPRTAVPECPPTLDSLLSFSNRFREERPRTAALLRQVPQVERRSLWHAKSGCRRAGLMNLGNTCFMNSCLQCLFSIPPLTQYLSAELVVNGSSPLKGQLVEVFATLLHRVCNGGELERRVASPAAFKKVIGEYVPHFAGFCQQDAQEFLRFLIDGLHEDTNNGSVDDALDHCSFGEDESSVEEVDRHILSRRAWARHRTANNSFVSGLFSGQLQSTVECLNCRHRSYCYDIFLDLSLPIAPRGQTSTLKSSFLRRVSAPLSRSRRLLYRLRADRASVQGSASSAASVDQKCPADEENDPILELSECLASFAAEEILDGSERYICERCNRRVRSRKRLLVYRFPQVLVLHLKRFKYTLNSRDKLNTRIRLPPKVLDLSPYAASVDSASSGEASINKYTLIAVALHFGNQGGGHYSALCRDILRDTWFYCNDSVVRETTLEEAYDERDAYLLFFLRKDVADMYSSADVDENESKK